MEYSQVKVVVGGEVFDASNVSFEFSPLGIDPAVEFPCSYTTTFLLSRKASRAMREFCEGFGPPWRRWQYRQWSRVRRGHGPGGHRNHKLSRRLLRCMEEQR